METKEHFSAFICLGSYDHHGGVTVSKWGLMPNVLCESGLKMEVTEVAMTVYGLISSGLILTFPATILWLSPLWLA